MFQELHDNIVSISPDPSVDRLSVTWADAEADADADGEEVNSTLTLSKYNFFTPGTPPANTKMEVRFPGYYHTITLLQCFNTPSGAMTLNYINTLPDAISIKPALIRWKIRIASLTFCRMQ